MGNGVGCEGVGNGVGCEGVGNGVGCEGVGNGVGCEGVGNGVGGSILYICHSITFLREPIESCTLSALPALVTRLFVGLCDKKLVLWRTGTMCGGISPG